MRAFEFLIEQDTAVDLGGVNKKLQFVLDKLNAGEVQDPETIDFIYKILNKPQIKQAVSGLIGEISKKDTDVAAFEKLNQDILNKILRKMPVAKEELDAFLEKWASGESFVNVELLTSGSSGSIADLIPDPTAYKAYELFESVKSVYKLPKKGVSGAGEFGLSMLSPMIKMKAPGDIEVNGSPVEVKGNNARLYADERSKPTSESKEVFEARGDEPGLITNVIANLSLDPTVESNQKIIEDTAKNVIDAFKTRGVDATQLIQSIKDTAANNQGQPVPLSTLSIPWWKAGFTAYQKTINMPIMVIGFGKFYISNSAEDFVQWGCLPKSPSNFGYLFGRQAGQSRETYPKIFVPGHNK